MPESAASPTAGERTVTVVGQATASATPDTALLRLGVEARGPAPPRPWTAADARWMRCWPRCAGRGSSPPA
jgi:uncharacterized protein YggE